MTEFEYDDKKNMIKYLVMTLLIERKWLQQQKYDKN